MDNQQLKQKKAAARREYWRKKLVYIKRNPQIFPKILLVITCCFYTFNLTPYSFAAFDVQKSFPETIYRLPAVFMFTVTLLSFLTVISFISVGAKLFKKPAPVIITFAFAAIQIVLQIVYIVIFQKGINALTPAELLLHKTWGESVGLSIAHLILLGLSVASIALMPVYAKALAKINTSRPVEQKEMNIEAVELADEE